VIVATEQFQTLNQSILPQRCFNCDDPGHFVRHRPLSRRQTSGELQRGNEDLQPHQVNRASDSSYINLDSYSRVTIENKVYDCLLDTGSEVCILPEAVVDPSHIKETRRILRAANGTAISTLGEATLPMSIGSFDTSVTGLVSDHVSEIMLGINWLVANEAVWVQSSGLMDIPFCYIRVLINTGGVDVSLFQLYRNSTFLRKFSFTAYLTQNRMVIGVQSQATLEPACMYPEPYYLSTGGPTFQ